MIAAGMGLLPGRRTGQELVEKPIGWRYVSTGKRNSVSYRKRNFSPEQLEKNFSKTYACPQTLGEVERFGVARESPLLCFSARFPQALGEISGVLRIDLILETLYLT